MMHEKVQRPDYVDMEDTELRDIRYRLNVLDHKLDTVLSKQDSIEKALSELKWSWNLILAYMEKTAKYIDTLTKFMSAINESDLQICEDILKLRRHIYKMHYDMQQAVYELTNVSWDKIDESAEPIYEQQDRLETIQTALEDIQERKIHALLDDIARNA